MGQSMHCVYKIHAIETQNIVVPLNTCNYVSKRIHTQYSQYFILSVADRKKVYPPPIQQSITLSIETEGASSDLMIGGKQ